MTKAVFLDTSVLCEVLRVPGRSQRPDAVAVELRSRIEANESLLLPTAAIIETGNHVAQVHDGRLRRDRAESLARLLQRTAAGEAPWVLNGATWDAALLHAICTGPRGAGSLADMAMAGMGLGDLSILAEAAAYEDRVARVTVEIWTFDEQLAAHT